jgi:hypothetical protein
LCLLCNLDAPNRVSHPTALRTTPCVHTLYICGHALYITRDSHCAQADTLVNMPGHCMFAKGAGCPCRDDRAPLCTLFKIAPASTRSQSFDGIMRSLDQIQARKAAILENMGHSLFAIASLPLHLVLHHAITHSFSVASGYASGGVEQYLSKDVRCCQCHFIPDDYTVREGKSGKIKSLVWAAKPHSSTSVEVAHAPVTRNPVGRSLARGLSALGVTPPLPVPSPTSGVLASASVFRAPTTPVQPTPAPATPAPGKRVQPFPPLTTSSSPVKLLRVAYEDHHERLEAAEDNIRRLEQVIEAQQQKLGEKDAQIRTLLDQYNWIHEHCMAQKISLDAAAEQAGLP